ncbi:MAG: 50S ribosomal protein L10 [Candidatus Micrarchaeota archaeon]|nr:50S ribosomal protein L10 [Candidatus Micrarchaeota archaeon]
MTKRKIKEKEKAKIRPAIQAKMKIVENIVQTASKYPVIGLLNLRNLPDRLLQSCRKKLRGSTEFIVAKNSVIARALDKLGKSQLAEHLDSPTALIFTTHTPYSIYKFFKENKIKIAAKPGQLAPFDIVVPEGETDLPPGPALSELKNAGINAQIKAGKIVVAKDSVVAKKGTKIPPLVCKALQKLNILPFEAMANVIALHDGKYVYRADILDLDEQKLAEELRACLIDAFNLSYNSSFPTSQNIEALLSSAILQGRSLAINGHVYSEASTGLLLAQAVLIGETLSGKVGNLETTAKQAQGG